MLDSEQTTEIAKYFNMECSPFSVRIPERLMEELKIEAKRDGRTIGKYLTAICAEHIVNKRQGKLDV